MNFNIGHKASASATLTRNDATVLDMGDIEEYSLMTERDGQWKMDLLTPVEPSEFAGDVPPILLMSEGEAVMLWKFRRPDNPDFTIRVAVSGEYPHTRHLQRGWMESMERRIGKPTRLRFEGDSSLFERT